MISNHSQFLDAIRDQKQIRITYYSQPDAGKVDRECVPLDYGPALDPADKLNRYWIWDYAATAEANPLALLSDQIVSVHVLGLDFDPAKLALGNRTWTVPRAWGAPPAMRDATGSPAPAAPIEP